MSMFEMVTKVAYALLTLTLLSINFAGIPASYLDIETRVDQAYIDDYRKLAVLENVMALDGNERLLRTELSDNAYRYERQRAVIPVEFFLEGNEGNDVLGYQTTDTGDCYFDSVPAMDGDDYAFYVEIQESYRTGDPGFQDPRSLGCTGVESPQDSVSAPALLIRKANGNPRLPVQIGIYSPEEGDS